jgi:carbonic anhydrase
MKTLRNIFFGLGLAASLALAPTAFASGHDHGHGDVQEHADAHGHGHGAPAAAKQMNSQEAIKAVIKGNEKFKHHHDSHHFDSFQTGQAPSLTVITSSDSRLHTHLFGMEPDNNIFIIRNIGNQVKNSEGSVDYGVRHLHTKILMILGHSNCGAIKAAMGDYSNETEGIKAELDTLAPVIAADDKQGDKRTRWGKNIERNVDYQVRLAMELYEDRIDHGELTVVGAVYDFNNLYGKGRGTLVITNINGETTPNKIMGHPVLEELNKGDIVNHVGSIAPAL